MQLGKLYTHRNSIAIDPNFALIHMIFVILAAVSQKLLRQHLQKIKFVVQHENQL